MELNETKTRYAIAIQCLTDLCVRRAFMQTYELMRLQDVSIFWDELDSMVSIQGDGWHIDFYSPKNENNEGQN